MNEDGSSRSPPAERAPAAGIARRAVRRLEREWQRRRPLPRPRYVARAPKTNDGGPLDPVFPANAATIAAGAQSMETVAFVIDVLDRLTCDDELERQLMFYRYGQAKFGRNWRYAGILMVLRAAALLVKPAQYLEIGVRKGRSAAVMGATSPRCAIYAFDLWNPAYGDEPNPGPELVRRELGAVGHTGELVLVQGDSRETVPAFLRAQPELYFDVATVDGDHSVVGAAEDLANTLPRLKIGGVLVFDDIREAPLLMSVWERLVRRDGRFVTWEYAESGYGVALAVRVEQ